MIRSRMFVLASVAVVALAACAPKVPPPPDTAADEAALRQMQDREFAALQSGNIDSMLANYTDDIVMMAPDEAAVSGSAALRTWLEAFLKEATVSGRYTSAEVEVAGDIGIVRYTGEQIATPKATGATPTTHIIKGIHVYKRQPGGGWKIAQDVWNNDPPAKPAAK